MKSTFNPQTVEEVLQHVNGLRLRGYEMKGNWTLGQICNHLVQSIDFTRSGFVKLIPRFVQSLFLATFLRLTPLGIIGSAFGLRMPTTFPQKQPIDDLTGTELLIDRLLSLQSPASEHLLPFHLWHCRHHLAFLVPRPPNISSP